MTLKQFKANLVILRFKKSRAEDKLCPYKLGLINVYVYTTHIQVEDLRPRTDSINNMQRNQIFNVDVHTQQCLDHIESLL